MQPPSIKKIIAIIGGVFVVGILSSVVYINYINKTNKEIPQVVLELKTYTFEKFGFSIDLPISKEPSCDSVRERTKEEAYAKNEAKDGYEVFCNTIIDGKTPSIHIGWKDSSKDNTAFVKSVATDFTTLVAGPKKFTFTCDNKTGIATAIAPPFPSRAFTCLVTIDGTTYTMSFFVFNTQKHPGTNNFIMMVDIDAPGSFKNEMLIDLGRTVKLVKETKPLSSLFFDIVYADPDDGGDGGDAGGGGAGTGSGTGGIATDSDGNQISSGTDGLGWGSGCSSCSSGGGDGTTTGGTGGGSVSVVNGACSVTHYNCSAGNLGGTAEYPDATVPNWYAYQWWCNGINGGTNILCTEYKPNPTGTLSASPLSCQISLDASSCQSTLTWTTANPQGTSGVTRDGTAGLLFSGNNDSKVTNVPYEADGSVTYRLYNNAVELASATVLVTCSSGKYDTDNNVCADPTVVSAVVEGTYYPPGSITLTCSNSDSYSVTFNGVIFVATTTYTGPVVIPNVSQEGNYVIKCIHGSVSDQVTRFYDATPPASSVSLFASPVTVGKDGKVVLTWKTKFPNAACSLSARVVCPNNACSQAQNSYQTSLGSVLLNEKTDQDDPATSRPIQTAIKTVAPGHVNTDWMALGKKTLKVSYTTDFTYDCGGTNKETKRIQVTKSDLQ